VLVFDLRWIGYVVLATALGGCVMNNAPQAAPRCSGFTSTGVDAEEIRRLEQLGAQSNVDGWSIGDARAFFAAEWITVGPDGAVAGVEVVFAQFTDGRSTPWAGRFELVELDVRVYCDMAVVIGLGEATPKNAPADFKPVRFRYTNVWRRDGERWLYAANQFTRF
jgi:ketosteroid isomerase-like protein